MRIGLIEDNVDFREEVAFHLKRAGFTIALACNGRDIDRQLASTPCDLLVLDLGLPWEDGLAITRRLRASQSGLGIVMLTARGSLEDRLLGLQEGADAYLVKPVDMRELVAVVESVQRRLAQTVPSQPPSGWNLDLASLKLLSPDGMVVMLTANERDLLKVLADAVPAPASRRNLAIALGHFELDFDDRRLEVAFSRLRQKIETATTAKNILRSARGKGYVFAAPLTVIPR